MAKYSNQVTYDIKTTLDASGITKLRSELNKLNQDVATIGKKQWGLKDSEIQRTVAQVNRLQTAITECFNPKIGMLDLSKFNRTLEQEKALLGTINTDWAKMGAQGTRAINSLASSVLNLNKDAITMNSTLSKIANTFSNTVRWGITASIFQEMMSSVQGAVSYMKDLDESLTQIQMVTNSSKEDMRELAQYANNAAQALGSTTTDYTNAVKVFVQEGFSESESKQYANLSTKLANVSEQSTAVTSDQITAYRNAFQLDYQQTVEAMDKVANVANNTASNVNELMTASQRAASVAQAVGSSQDSFLAAIATIESVTRQSAEEIGNGLKTIYQRFADIKTGKSAEDGVDYGQYAKALQSVGVDVLDAAGQFKGMDQILKELQEVWSGLDDTMKIAVGEKVAGKFQYNRFAALMNNPEYYEKALAATGAGSQGMMDQMNEYYVESIEGRLNILRSAGEQIMSSLFDQDNIEPIIGAATDFLNIINNIIETLGGGLPVFEALSAIILRTFSSQIGEQVARITTNIQTSMQASTNAGLMDETLGRIQEKTGQQGGAIGEIRGVLQGEDFARLSDTTQEKVLANAQQLLEAENKVADVKNQQQLLQQQINKDLANNSELADVILAESKAQYELGAKQLQQAQDRFDAEIAFGDLSEEEIEYRESELKAAEEAVEADRIRYEQTQARINLGEQLDNYTLEELVALDKRNAELGEATNYAERYLEYTQAASAAEGELTAASSQLKGIQEQINTEKIATSVTNLVSGLTSVLFLTQSAISLWQLWTNEDATFEDKVVGTISSLAMILPMAVTAWQALVAVRLADVAAGAASLAGHIASIPVLITEGLAAGAASAGFTSLAAAISAANIALMATPIGWILAGIAAIVAAIVGLVTLYNNWQDSLHSSNKEFKEQKELLSELKHHYDEINGSVDTLKKSIDSISDKRTALDDLEEGTLEWKEAVVALNQEVVNLLETYPKLAEFVKNENGILSFEEGALDRFYEEQLDVARSAQNMVAIQQARTYSASSDSAIEDFANQNSNGFHTVPKEVIETFVDKINEGSIDIKEACEKLGLDVDKNGDELAALAETVKSNTVATDALNTTLGNTTDYQSFASTPDSEKAYQQAYDALGEKYGSAFNGADSLIASVVDNRNEIVNQQDFKDIAQGALQLQGSVTSIREAADSWDWVIRTSTGEEVQVTKQALQEKMALYQAEQDIERQNLEENKKIYEAFGIDWDDTANKPKGELSADNQAALNAFLNDESFKRSIQSFDSSIDSVEAFAEAIKTGTISVDGLSETLAKLQNTVAADLKTNINGNEFTNRVDISSNKDAMKELLDDANMDETAFNRMARDSYEEEGGYYQQQKQKLEELIAVKEKDTDITEEEQEELSRLRLKLDDLDDSAKDTTAMLLRMSNGVVKLRNNIEDISEILTDEAARGTTEWYQALDDLDKGLSDVLNIDAGTLSDEFLESGDALDYARRMAEGDMSAIDDLRIAAAQDIVQNLSIQANPEDVETIRQELMVELNQLQADINAGAITVGTDLDTYPFIDKLNHMLAESQISAEQASNILSSIGMEATIQHATGPGYVDEIQYEAIPSLSSFSFNAGILGEQSIPIPSLRIIPHTVKKPTTVDYPYIQGAQYTGPGVQTANTAARNPNYTGGYSGNPKRSGGGGGKSPKGSSGSNKDTKPKDKDKTEWDYLTDITNDLDRAAAVIEKLSKLEDRLYGSSRVSQIKKLQKEYKNYIGLLEQEVKLAENHAQLLRSNAYDENGNLTINGYGYRAGVGSLQFDAQNNLENGKEIEARLVDRVNAAIDDYNAHRNDDDASYYEERVSLAQKDHEGFLKALSEYESTLGKIEDGQSQIQDYKEKIQDATDEIVDAIQDGIEDVLEAIDSQRDFNKMYRDWMQGGSGYSHLGNQHRYYTEGLEGLLSPDQNGASVFDMQLQSLQDRIKDFKDVFDGNSQNADDEKLSEQAAFENLQEATKNIMGSLEKAIDYYDSLLETIQDASDKMDELIDDRLDEFNNLEDYLDTRLDQLKLLFGDKSYEQQAQLYNEKIAVNMEKMVSINTAIEAKQATVKALEGLEESGKELSTEERKELKDARNKVTSLQKEQLDTESQLLQDIANRLSNQVNAELDTAINNLFGGEDVDWLTQQWELSTRLSEQYLDDYNRAFELQKLQIKYQELLNDTQATSAMAQQRISAQMMQQLKYLREKNHLSEYDIEYAEKKLEILQRELALEDARNNKSQMRLQRNAAGNYDFVYAADEDAINDAKMALLNAQQEAYNLSKQMYKEIYDGALKLSKELKQMVFDVATDASLTTEQQAERIKWIMENTSEYLGNASVELGEVSVNLYNDIADAEQLIAEENLGNLADIFEIMRAQSKATQESVGQDLSDGRDNAINAASDTFGGIQGLSSGTQKAVSGDFEDIEGSLNTMLSNSYTNVDGTIAKIVQGSSERSGDIIGVIGNIDKNFELSTGNMLTNTKSIDETFKGAFDNIAGDKEDSYLNQYKNKTSEVLEQAGEEYGTFTEQSINHATEQLGLLRQATQDWNGDLDILKQMVKNNADEIKGWKTEIEFAIKASQNFITESNNLQDAFSKIGAMATIAGGMLDDFGEAAYGAGAAVDTMSHDIEGAYYAIRDAASAAAQAYSDMAWAARDAAIEADNARVAAENAQIALNAAGIANNIMSGTRTVVSGAFNWLNNLTSGKAWGGGGNGGFSSSGRSGRRFDTGGYTGTWTDQGIDDKSGKWAILHQKELVLNADDTKNMLSAVEVVRDIMSNINSLPSLGKITTQNNLTDTIEQRVEINATFPGVTEAIQIKQALEQIADNAYQVANKYKY